MRTWAFLFLLGCTSSADRDPPPKVFVADASPTGAAASRPGPAAPAGPVSPPAAIGVEACDRFARSYARCIAELPPPERGAANEALAAMMSAWKTTLDADPTARDAISRACAEAMAAEARTAGSRCPGVSFTE